MPSFVLRTPSRLHMLHKIIERALQRVDCHHFLGSKSAGAVQLLVDASTRASPRVRGQTADLAEIMKVSLPRSN